MLDDKELVELNNKMLSLGRPNERDYMGYNKPDYSLMYNLAYIPPDKLSESFKVVMIDTLRHYINTQLEKEKEELEATWEYYKEKLLKQKDKNFINYINNKDTTFLKGANEEWKPQNEKNYNEIDIFYCSADGLLLNFIDIKTAHIFKNNNDDVYYKKMYNSKTMLNEWFLYVPYEKLTDFINVMKKARKKDTNGYRPSKKLQTVLNDIPKFKEKISKIEEERKKKEEEQKKRIEKAKLIVYLIKKNIEERTITVSYDAYIKELCEFNRQHYGIRVLKDYGKWNIEISYNLVDEWLNCAKNTDLILRDELKDLTSKKLIQEADEYEAKKLQEYINKHKNNNKLIDINTLNLPFKPYPFQIEDAKKLLTRDKMLIGHDMGCGKTFISGLVGTSIKGKKIVVCPESLRLNWKKEMENLGQEAIVIYSKNDFHTTDNPNGFTIMGYSTVSKFKDKIIKAKFTTIFVDEAHNCKAVNNIGNPSSKRADAVMDIVAHIKYAYLLSGTPIPARNKDLYNILKMLDVKEIDFNEPHAFFNYGVEYCDGKHNGYGWSFDGNTNSDTLHNILAPYMVRRIKKEVLPNLIKQRIFIPLPISNRQYRGIETKLKKGIEESDTYLGLAMKGRRILSKCKVKSAIELTENMLLEDKSVVIVTNFNETLDTIKDKFKDNCCLVRGGMKDTEKQKSIDDFQSGRCKICAINIIAGGVGITLTKAHDMIICDFDWTPANMIQVEDRICRKGQTEPCNIHYLYGEDCILDELFIQMITKKNANIDKVVDNSENSMDLEMEKQLNSKSYIELLKQYMEK